jgi:hypothetical protein
VVPDAQIIARAIIDGVDMKQREAISAQKTTPIMTQIYGLGYNSIDMEAGMRHHFLFTAESLLDLLQSRGFVSVQEYNRSEDPSVKYRFNNDADGPFSLFCKAYKPK